MVMARQPSRKKRVLNNRFRDANATLPETLTGDVIRMIHHLESSNSFHSDEKIKYLQKMFMTKFVSSETDSADVRAQRAINKWLSVERDNDATNTRLLLTLEDYNILPRVTWRSFIDYARGLITKLLGDTVPIEAIFGGFSGGATTTRSRFQSHPALKYLGQADVTSAAHKWFDLLLEESPLWREFSTAITIREVEGNHLFTVPKSTTIDRVACKEPDLNMYLQKGVGNYIRRRLRTVGINLNDQSINRNLAREGSISDKLATIDLSSASDSVSLMIVELLLPDLWFGLLSDLRSPSTLIRGEWHKNHMFSSMGNGFTFELESLIFWALSYSVRHFMRGSGVISVYGDDIIVGSDYVHELISVLDYVGFSVNRDKSFTSGPFRESCGGHYHLGDDITPFFLRRPIAKVRDAIVIANQIRKWASIPWNSILDCGIEPLWLHIRSFIPKGLWGGDNLEDDSQLVDNTAPRFRLAMVTQQRDNGDGGYLLWLDTCEGASDTRDVIISSNRFLDQSKYRLRRVKAEKRKLPSIFISELAITTETQG